MPALREERKKTGEFKKKGWKGEPLGDDESTQVRKNWGRPVPLEESCSEKNPAQGPRYQKRGERSGRSSHTKNSDAGHHQRYKGAKRNGHPGGKLFVDGGGNGALGSRKNQWGEETLAIAQEGTSFEVDPRRGLLAKERDL